MLRPSTSQRTGSLVSLTHQLWSSPSLTIHQSRVEVGLAMVQNLERKFSRSVLGRGPITSTKAIRQVSMGNSMEHIGQPGVSAAVLAFWPADFTLVSHG